MIKYLVIVTCFVSGMLFSTLSYSNNMASKPVSCIPDHAFYELVKQNDLKIIVAANTDNVTKLLFVNPKNSNLILVHHIKANKTVCLIDDLVNVQTTLELVPKDSI